MNNQNGSVFVPDGKNAIHDGIEHNPGGGKALLDPTDTVFLFLESYQNAQSVAVSNGDGAKAAARPEAASPVGSL